MDHSTSKALKSLSNTDVLREEYKRRKYKTKVAQITQILNCDNGFGPTFPISCPGQEFPSKEIDSYAQEKMLMYEYCACSSIQIESDSVIIKIQTWYLGDKKESFYAVIKSNESLNFLYVMEHNYPNWLPAEHIEARLLNKNLEKYTSCVADCLNGYVSRKYQVAAISKLLDKIFYSESYDYVIFCFDFNEQEIRCSLFYKDLRDITPSDVSVINLKLFQRDQYMESIFKSNLIQNAFEKMVKHDCVNRFDHTPF